MATFHAARFRVNSFLLRVKISVTPPLTIYNSAKTIARLCFKNFNLFGFELLASTYCVAFRIMTTQKTTLPFFLFFFLQKLKFF